MRVIRFDNKNTREEREATDKLAAIRQIWDVFLSNCTSNYKPSAYLTVDEQLVPFRGNCKFRVCMKSKPGKYGIKIWICADAETFYCCNAQIYVEKEGGRTETGQGSRVVKDLVTPYYNSGRSVTTDNFFTSYSLAQDLIKKKLSIVGTISKAKTELPTQLLPNRKREKYSTIACYTKDTTLISYVPKKYRGAILLSTLHNEYKVEESDKQKKPDIIKFYNETKGGVDGLDQIVQTYSCRRKTRRLPLVLFFNVRHFSIKCICYLDIIT
jgi:hypothetical protein